MDDIETLREGVHTLQRQLDAARLRDADSTAIFEATGAILAAPSAHEVEIAMFSGLLSVSKAKAAVLLNEVDSHLVVVRASGDDLKNVHLPIGSLLQRVLNGAAVAVSDVTRLADFASQPGWAAMRGAVLLPYQGGTHRGIVALMSDTVGSFQAADAARLKVFGVIASQGLAAFHRFQLHIDHQLANKARVQLERMVRERTVDLEAATVRAESANRAKSQFLSVMSHELRTPLNAVIGYSEMLQEIALEEGRAGDVKDHGHVLGAAHHLLHLLNQVLDLSKVEAGRMDVELGTFDAAEIAAEALEIVRPKARQNFNRLEIDLAPDLGECVSDEHRLRQCLLNLLSNAVKFTKNGTVTLRGWRASDGMLVFEVADSGMGISPADLATLFQPFVQANASITRKFGGTGLGLAITRRIAQHLGGDVSASSKFGVGSTFRLTVAAALNKAGCAGAAQPRPEEAAPSPTRLVMGGRA